MTMFSYTNADDDVPWTDVHSDDGVLIEFTG